ncbi:uncharacterized protein [Branchiostoma lanceolatum]|uniref:uncharacterized protein isoform X4 n=1 Tax=Branchiostoma lanceolatum TaxID=7740 RepID=UPI00345263AB
MAVNLRKNEKAMLAAWKDVCEDHSDTDWALFGYEANTNDLKLVSTGDGGLEELVDDFSSGKVMYAFCRVNDPNTNLPKNVLINWSGEAVPTSRKGACANHVRDVGNFFHGAHVTVNARDEDDVEPEAIMEKVAKSTSSKYPAFGKGSSQQQRIENQGPVGSVYKKTQAASEIKSSQKQREDFWAQQEKEEKARVAEEKKQATADRARLEKERLDRERREAEDREKKVKERDLMTRQQKKEEANIDKSMMQKERDIEKARWETIQKEEQQEDKTRRKRSESLTKAAQEDSRLHITEPLSPSDKKGYGNWTAKPWTGQASAGGFRSVSFKPATPPSSPGPGVNPTDKPPLSSFKPTLSPLAFRKVNSPQSFASGPGSPGICVPPNTPEDFDQEYQNTVQQLIASRPQQTKHGRTFVLTGTKETRTTDGMQAELHRVVTTETTQKQTVETKLARNPYIDTTPIVQYNQPADVSADLNNDDDDVEDPNLITEMVRKQSRLIHGKKKPTFLAKQVGMFEKPVEAEVNPFKVQLEAETRRSRPRILPGDGAPKAGFQPTCVVSTPVCHAPTPSHITPNKPAHKHPQAAPTQVTPQRPLAAANKTAPPRPAQPAVQSYLPRSTPHSHTEPKTTPSNVGHKPVAQPDAAKSQPVPMGSCLPKKPPAPSQAKSDPTGNQEDRKVDGVFESHPYTEEEDDGPPPNTALEAAALVAQRGDFNPRSMWQQHNVPPPLPSTRPSGPASPAKKKPVGYPLQPVPDMTSSAEAPPTEESRELPTNTALEAKALVSQRQNNPKDMWKDFHVPPPPPNLPLPPSPVKKPKTQEPRPKIVYEPAITEPLVQSCSWHASSLLGDTSFLISSTKDTTVPAAVPVQNGGPTHSTEQATLPDRPDGPLTNTAMEAAALAAKRGRRNPRAKFEQTPQAPLPPIPSNPTPNTAMEAASLVHQKGSFNPELARLKFDNKEASPNTALEAAQLVSQRGTFNPRAMFEPEPSNVSAPARPSGAPPQKLKHSWGQSQQEAEPVRSSPPARPAAPAPAPQSSPALVPQPTPAQVPPPQPPAQPEPAPEVPPAEPAPPLPTGKSPLTESLSVLQKVRIQQDSDEEQDDQDWDEDEGVSQPPVVQSPAQPAVHQEEPVITQTEETHETQYQQQYQEENQQQEYQQEYQQQEYQQEYQETQPAQDYVDDQSPVETGLRARALYDYQASADDEISFDPDEIITDIEQIDEGWWRGVGPDGTYGLFPANYVELI